MLLLLKGISFKIFSKVEDSALEKKIFLKILTTSLLLLSKQHTFKNVFLCVVRGTHTL